MPQASFLYAAPVQPGREVQLRTLLASMNLSPGIVNPHNELVPFASFEYLHFARLLIVSDLADADRAVYNLSTATLPDYLVLMGEVDGTEKGFRTELVRYAQDGLRRLFSHCTGFDPDKDLIASLREMRVSSAAEYVNWVGRTAQQEREEELLRRSLLGFLQTNERELSSIGPREIWMRLRSYVQEQQRAGVLTLTAAPPTPWSWRLRNLFNLVAVPLVLLLLSPLLLLYLPFFLIQQRRWEKNDPAVAPPLDPAHAHALEGIENYDVANQFSVFGSLKPGRIRLWSMRLLLWIVDYTARHIFYRGALARVQTIHFARWVVFDGGERVLFSSIYDGSLESYMDDFINKVGFGLNITFSNGIGYPRTRWLLLDGCKDEQTFKRVLRRHQLTTDVWYSATPGLTAANKQRNAMIRDGLQAESMTDRELGDWIALL